MNLKETYDAVIRVYQSDDDIWYRVTSVDGEVIAVSKQERQYEDTGDAENGPHLTSFLGEPEELITSHDWLDTDNLADVIADAEAFTFHCKNSQ